MLKVYVDTGGEMPDLRRLRREGLAESVHFPYDQRLKRIDTVAQPSNLTWGGSAATWADLKKITPADAGIKPMHDAIAKIIGAGNAKDIQHMASAHAAGCHAFITSDKGDIWRHRDALHELLSIRVFHSATEWPAFIALCESHSR